VAAPAATVGDVPTHLDAASGAPLHAVARQALDAALADGWADPGRRYGAARRARMLLDAARESAAEAIGARPDELSFAANGTQALHAAVLGTLAGDRRRPVFVHSAVEHSAVLQAAQQHVGRGGSAVAIAVDALGRVDTGSFAAAASRDDVAAAALQSGNHEVGTRQPVTELATAVAPVPMVVDASQTLGHEPVPDGWSVLAADARMWGAPPVGLLAVRTGVRWRAPWPTDDYEAHRIPGAPNVPAIVAAAAALRAVRAEQDETAGRHRRQIARIRDRVAASVPDVEVLGDPDDRLPHIVTFSCLYVDGESLLAELDRRGFAVSSGSSCTSSTVEPSHVLVAMGALTSGNVRVSLPAGVTDEDVDRFLAVLPDCVAAVRAELGASGL
jgi:cysteine desulfurase